jgi:magnesium transporter
MDSIVDGYFPVIDALGEQLEILQERIFRNQVARRQNRFTISSGSWLSSSASVSLIDVCTKVMRFDLDEVIPEDTRPYFRDLYDHVIRVNETVDSTREILATALAANFSLVSISQNEIQKRFAGWAAILGVPTMVAGILRHEFQIHARAGLALTVIR